MEGWEELVLLATWRLCTKLMVSFVISSPNCLLNAAAILLYAFIAFFIALAVGTMQEKTGTFSDFFF